MRTEETTNGKLGEVRLSLEELITWAEADAQHSLESDAKLQAASDIARARHLTRALALVNQCTR